MRNYSILLFSLFLLTVMGLALFINFVKAVHYERQDLHEIHITIPKKPVGRLLKIRRCDRYDNPRKERACHEQVKRDG